jgi:hypothetical protein
VQLLGYVKIGYAKRSLTTVTAQISKYAGWAARKRSIAVDGVFVDEAPYQWNETTSKYFGDIRNAVKSAEGLGRRLISQFLLSLIRS